MGITSTMNAVFNTVVYVMVFVTTHWILNLSHIPNSSNLFMHENNAHK